MRPGQISQMVIGPAGAATVLWRMHGTLQVTVVVKATLALVHDGPARLVSPDEVAVEERPFDGVAGRSVEVASDLAPHKGKADVTFVGHAHAPGGRPAPTVAARLAVFREKALLDKTLHVYGERTLQSPTPTPFQTMRVTYERAYGGPRSPANPVGVGAETVLPNIVDRTDPLRPNGFGPISRHWPSRRRVLGTLEPEALNAPVVTIPSAQIFAYFQAAPPDQQIELLRGDEWIVLDNLHPTLARLSTRLPGLRAATRVHLRGAGGFDAGGPIQMRLDTLAIDGDRQLCSVVFRGNFPVIEGEKALSAMLIVCGVETPDTPIPWPAPADLTPTSSPASAPAAPAPAPAPAAAAPRKRKLLEGTAALSDEALAQLRAGSVTPFSASDPSAPASLPPSAPPPRSSEGLTGTTALSDTDHARIALEAPLPFALPRAAAPAPAAAAKAIVERRVPARTTPAVPIATDVPVSVATLSWQVRPPRDSLTVVVKGTFDLVDGNPARMRAEPEPVLGDVHAGDDPEKGLLYASDLAIFKPRCDVTVAGHAHPSRGSGAHAQVAFRVGTGPKRIERSANVIGDRIWKKALGLVLAPSDPEPFETMPLVHSRAFGAPGHESNPEGTGHKSSAAPDGTVRLPNLEDPNKPIRSPGDSPPPVCFAPIAPSWKARAARLGTYDKKWLAVRWPYFPEDYDWQSTQHAPPSQQTDYLIGDEPYETRGMRPGGAVLRGDLPGLKLRCFAERAPDAGGGFHEVPLKLDTVHFDLDDERLVLVWRGLVEVTDEDAPELAALFVTAEPTAGPALSLTEAREKMLDVLVPPGEPIESPEPEHRPANDVAPPDRGARGKSPETLRIEAELAARQAQRGERLDAAGVSPGAGSARAPRLIDPLPSRPGGAPPPTFAPDPALRERAIAALDAGQDLADLDLSDADLSNLDFEGRSLTGAVLLRARLCGCNFRGADLTGAQLGGADLTDARLDGATLAAVDLDDARLDRASFEGATLDGASFSRAHGAAAVFRGARGAQPRFVEGNWASAVFDEADLPAADFSGATLDEASFVRARLVQVRLLDCRGRKARFDGACLDGARGTGASLPEASFRAAEAPGSQWEDALLEQACFFGTVLTGAGFSRAKAAGADFSGAGVVDGRFHGAGLRGARFLRANLMRASFEKADLQDADLRGANLHECETWKARTRGAKLDLAIVTRSKLRTRKG